NLLGAAGGVPKLIPPTGNSLTGDRQILSEIDGLITTHLPGGSLCQLPNNNVSFSNLRLTDLPGKPQIWSGDRIAIRLSDGDGSFDSTVKGLLLAEEVDSIISELELPRTAPQIVDIAGTEISFTNAVQAGEWLVQWNQPERVCGGDRVSYSSYYSFVLLNLDEFMLFLIAVALILLAIILFRERRFRKNNEV
ncbi:MAG: hypothetical protein ABH851_00810, partial [Methanobacteriota archaeon]